MYAVVNTGGKQAKVEKGSLIAVEKLDAKVGATVSLAVLMIADGDRVLVTPAELAGASVTAEVLEHFKGEKQMIFKFKKRKGYKRTKGHRQVLTSIRILDIVADGAPAKAKKADKVEAAPKTVEAPVAKAEKPETAPAKAAPAAKKAEPAPAKAAPVAKKAEPAPAKAAAPKKAPAAAAAKAAAPKKAVPAKSAEPAQCAAVKSDGTRCANKAKEGSEYCGVHAKQQ